MSSLSQRGNFSTRYRQKNFRRTFHKKKFFPWQRYRKLTYKNPKHSFIVFNENPYFDTLDDFEKLFALMFWVKRHCNHSEAELSQDLGLTKKNVHILLAYAELTGIIKVKKQFRVVKNKRKKTETQTRMPTRPHRIVTSKGKKFLKAIVEQAWKGKPIPANLKPGIHIVNGVPKLEALMKPSDKRKVGGHKENTSKQKNVKEILEAQYKFSKENKLCQGKMPFASNFSFEKKSYNWTWSIWTQTPPPFKPSLTSLFNKTILNRDPNTYNYHRLEALLDEQLDKAHSVKGKNSPQRALFSKYGFLTDLENGCPGHLRALADEPLPKVCKTLRHIRGKLNKGWKFKSFWAYFSYQIKQEKFTYLAKMAHDYRDAIDGVFNPSTKRLNSGEDSSKFIHLCQQAEEITEEKLPVEAIEKLLGQRKSSSQIWGVALDAVLFRLKLDKPKEQEELGEDGMIPIYDDVEYIRVIKVQRPGGFTVDRPQNYYKREIVGYKPTKNKKIPRMPPKNKVGSWIGLFMHTVKIGSVEAIREAFYKKRKEKSNQDDPKTTPLDMDDFDFNEGDCFA